MIKTKHLSNQLVVVREGYVYYYRPCLSHTSALGDAISFTPDNITCESCKQTDLFQELLLEYELGDKNQREFGKMYHQRLKENVILVESEQQRLDLSVTGQLKLDRYPIMIWKSILIT